MGNRRFVLSLLLAAALHLAALWLWPTGERRPSPPLPLEIVIELERAPVLPSLPNPAPKPALQPAPLSDTERDRTVESNAVIAAPAIASEAIEIPQPTRPVPTLDLSRPEQWEIPAPRGETERLVREFRPQLHAGVEARRTEQARRRLLDARRIAVAGRTPDEYNAIDPNPFLFKTEQGCFELRPELDGRVIGELRWWQVSCNEPLVNPLLMPALEYDALGRAAADEL